MASLSESLKLPCGKILKNRIVKAAMSENMADPGYIPGERFLKLYEVWGNSGAGMLITGNVMVDRSALGEPHNIVLDKQNGVTPNLKTWAKLGSLNETLLVMQINHPGKQIPKNLSKLPVAPSAIPLNPPLDKVFNTPRELLEEEIWEIIERFAISASLAKEAGFSGVQIHGAHGYLISQFLSPKHNKRSDQWGGPLENRMRFLLEVYKAIRDKVGDEFIIGLKINSADFQRGGFSEEDSMKVIEVVDKIGLDFIEVSGGSYESAEMMGSAKKKESTKRREAYFLDYAVKVKERLTTPLMVTGGFRTKEGMEKALTSGSLDMIGLARPFAVFPSIAKDILSGEVQSCDITPKATGINLLDALTTLEITWYAQQIHRIAKGEKTKPNYNVWFSAFKTLSKMIKY